MLLGPHGYIVCRGSPAQPAGRRWKMVNEFWKFLCGSWMAKGGGMGDHGGGWLEHPRPWRGAQWAELFLRDCRRRPSRA